MSEHWILDEHDRPMPVDDLLEWGRWYDKACHAGRTVVAQDRYENGETRVFVSTKFFGVDLRVLPTPEDPPVLWETMVFGLPVFFQRRYTSLEAARAGHREACAEVREFLKGQPR